jgi:hypothetical protein
MSQDLGHKPTVPPLSSFRHHSRFLAVLAAVLGVASLARAQDPNPEPATDDASANEPGATAPAPLPEPAAEPAKPAAPALAADATPLRTKAVAKKKSPSEIAIPQGHTLDSSGYLLPGRTVELGLYYMGYGITDWLNVGTNPGLWAVGPVLGGLVANASVRLGFPIANLASVSLDASPIFLRVNKSDGGRVRGMVVPITLAASLLPKENQSYSLAVRYVGVTGQDESDTDSQKLESAALTQVVQVTGQARFQVLRWLGLYSRVTVQPWEQDFGIDGSYQADPQTRVTVEGSSDATQSRPWSVVAGFDFRFGPCYLRLGGGYGNFFVPRIGVFTPAIPQPDFDFYVRF